MGQIRISVNGFDLSLEGPLDYESQAMRENVMCVQVWGQFGSGKITISDRGLIALADLIYRRAGQQPREVQQVVRVELVAAAPPAPAAAAPVLQLVEETDPEKDAIKARMMAGR